LADDLPPLQCRKSRRSGALTYPEPLGPPQPVAEYLYFTLQANLVIMTSVDVTPNLWHWISCGTSEFLTVSYKIIPLS